MARNWHISNIPSTSNAPAKPMSDVSDVLPHEVTFISTTPVLVYLLWRAPNAAVPTVAQVISDGSPLYQSLPQRLVWNDQDGGAPQDGENLFIAAASSGADLRAIA